MEVLGESLEILHEMIKKFPFFEWSKEAVLTDTLLDLFSPASGSGGNGGSGVSGAAGIRFAAVRKKAILCMSHLASRLEKAQLAKVLETCIRALTDPAANGGAAPHKLSSHQSALLKSQVGCVGSLVAAVGGKPEQGALLCQAIPSVLGFCEQREGESEDSDALEPLCELREACLACVASFVTHCAAMEACEKHLPAFVDLCRKYISYDPNFAYDDDMAVDSDGEGGGNAMDVDDNEGSDGYDGFEGSDYADEYVQCTLYSFDPFPPPPPLPLSFSSHQLPRSQH